MKLVYKLAPSLSLCLLLASQLIWASPFPQEDDEDVEEEEEEEEEVDASDIYDEEGNNDKDNNATVVLDEYEEKDRQYAIRRELIAKHLGINNSSRVAIVDKASDVVIKYFVERLATGAIASLTTTSRPTKKAKTAASKVVQTTTTKKYKILKVTERPLEISSTLELEAESVVPKSVEYNQIKENKTTANPVRTFVITVPQLQNGTGGGTIEITIPMQPNSNVTDETETSSGDDRDNHHISQMSISAPNVEGVKSIEAALLEALLIAQQTANMTMSTSSSFNGTEIFELDIDGIQIMPKNEKVDSDSTTVKVVDTTLESAAEELPSSPETILLSYPLTQQEFVIILPPKASTLPAVEPRPTRKRRPVRSTTPKSDLLAQVPQFLWKSVQKLAGSSYAKVAIDAVECAVFYQCPDEDDLGKFTKDE